MNGENNTLNDPDHALPDTIEAGTQALVACLRSGDPSALEKLESRYRARLVKFCWGYLGNMEEAEDAVQEVFFKVFQAPTVPDLFRAWLYRISRNQCLNMLRTRARRVECEALPEASDLDAVLTGQLTGMVRDETRKSLSEAVARLSEPQREALRLRYVENLSRAEIAEVLEVLEPVVKSRIFEGLQQLRQSIPIPGDS